VHFLVKIGIILLCGQALGLAVLLHRLRKRPRYLLVMIPVFIAANLPWIYIFSHPVHIVPSTGWTSSIVFRLFITWQVGLLLWLALTSLTEFVLLVCVRAPARIRRWARRRAGREEPPQPDRREFIIKTVRGAALGTAVAGGVWGLVRSEFRPAAVRRTIRLKNLPPAMDGLKIAHMSDLHLGAWTSPRIIPNALALTRDLKPDLVVITGDFIDYRPSFGQSLIDHVYLLERVPLGVFGVIGNHDVYTGASRVTKYLEEGGITMLRDRSYFFQNQGLPLALVGVDDPGFNWAGSGGPLHLGRAMNGVGPDLFPILLTHRPTGFEQARERAVPLTLCGHTHGGQFGIPGGPNLADFFYQYTHGLYEKDDSFIHVTAGIGSVGLPFRLGVPSEVVLLTLEAAPEADNNSSV
jgi:uncharacterized protein